MCTKPKPCEYYLSSESRSDAKESLSNFSLNFSEFSNKTAIRNVTKPSVNGFNAKFQNNNERISQMKNSRTGTSVADIDSRKFSFSFSGISTNASQTSQKSKSKFTVNDKEREVERHNEHFMKKLLKAKPTTDIKKSTSEMTLLQVRSEKHVPPASIRRRQKQVEIDTINRIIQKKLNAIASKKM